MNKLRVAASNPRVTKDKVYAIIGGCYIMDDNNRKLEFSTNTDYWIDTTREVTTTKKDNMMEIKTITYVDDVPIDTLSASDLVLRIEEEEARIKSLENMITTSPSIDNLVTEHKDNIYLLVEALEEIV